MSENSLARRSAGGRFLRLLGIAGEDDGPEPTASDHDLSSTPGTNPFREARRALMQQMADFLVGHDLDITPANLLRAHAAFSGANLHLARKISEKELEREPVTQAWLDSLAPPEQETGADKAQMDRLVAKLESSLETFTETTRDARSAAAEYNSELTRHAERIDQSEATGQMLATLAELTRAMLERTRQVEEDMKRSEREASSLRQSLEKARRDAGVDHLTGLPNRRAFEALLDHHYREAQKEIEPLCVAFCDIDHFKRVNDTHGHDTGDRVIQAIAQVLSRVSNDRCCVARHGGEEFVMLFRGMTRNQVRETLDQARESMAARRFVNRATDEPIGTITFSGGIADVFAYPDHSAALRAADEALYRAKEAGRNRIELA